MVTKNDTKKEKIVFDKEKKDNKFAIIRAGGKQYLVYEKEIILIEKKDGKKGDKINFEEVLMVGSKKDISFGAPVLSSIKVEAEIIDQFKANKVMVFKMKSKKRYRKTQGHRQKLTKVKITKI